jgi:hypothetical protein
MTTTDHDIGVFEVAWLLDRLPEAGDHEGKLTLADRQAWLDHVAAVGSVERTVFAPQDSVSLAQQAAAVERAAVNQRGHVSTAGRPYFGCLFLGEFLRPILCGRSAMKTFRVNACRH